MYPSDSNYFLNFTIENYSNISHDYPLIWMTCSCNRAVQYRLLSIEKTRLKLHRRCHKTYIWVYSYFCFKSEIKQIATFKTHVSSLTHYIFSHARTSVYKPVFNRLLRCAGKYVQYGSELCNYLCFVYWLFFVWAAKNCEYLPVWTWSINPFTTSEKTKMPNWSKHLDEFSECPKLSKDKLTFMNMRFCPYAQRVRLVLDAKKIP